jgi:peptidoglycan/xylan/chitin deacetylase (PgdA/CDA1 family)
LLPFESEEVISDEVRTCKRKIEARVPTKVRAFAYPNGDWDPRVRRQVADAGYDCAFTTQRGWYRRGDDRYTVRRILLHEGCVTGFDGTFSPAAFNLKLTGWR